MNRDPIIAGVAEARLVDGKIPGPVTSLSIHAAVAREALHDAGLELADVDGLATAGSWSPTGSGRYGPSAVAEYLGITPRFVDGTNAGGSSFEAHVAHAALAVSAGYCDVVLITYGSLQRSSRSRTLGARSSDLATQFDAPWGLPTPVGSYALAAMRYMHESGTTSEQLAEVAVAARTWSTLNPNATKRELITIDDVLSSPMVADPLHRLDCCLVTDGAGAVVVTHPDAIDARVARPVAVRGFGEAYSHLGIASMPDITAMPAAESGRRAFDMAGVAPDDIDVAEIYDSFTITTLLTLEALGFCERGSAGRFVEDQATARGGRFPMNTNGGGLAQSHPGMYGIFLIVEAVRQLRHEAGERQVADARLALASGTGLTLSSSSTLILSKESS